MKVIDKNKTITVRELIYDKIRKYVLRLKINHNINTITFEETNYRIGITVIGYPGDLERMITVYAYASDATIDIMFNKTDCYGKSESTYHFALLAYDITFIPKLIESWYR